MSEACKQQSKLRLRCRAEPALELPTGKPFDIHTAVPFTHIWINPRTGSDERSGNTRAEALQTFNAAWERIPEAVTLTQGFYIHILPGTFTEEQGKQQMQSLDNHCRCLLAAWRDMVKWVELFPTCWGGGPASDPSQKLNTSLALLQCPSTGQAAGGRMMPLSSLRPTRVVAP